MDQKLERPGAGRDLPARLARGAAIGGLLLRLTLGPGPAAAADLRAANDFERAYTALALDTESHELCARISPEAQTRALFNSPGTQIYRERSRCFLYVAVKALNPYLCREVVEAEAWFHDGSYFSRQNCESMVADRKPFRFTLSFDHALILKTMGYGDSALTNRFPRHPQEPAWLAFYLDALRRSDGDFQQRLRRLPDFSAD